MALVRIGIDATSWWNRRGFGRFTRELVRALITFDDHEFVLFVDRPADAEISGTGAEIVSVVTHQTVVQGAVAGGRRRVADMLALGRAAARARLDVMFYPAVWSWFPLLACHPNVVTLHDAIAERFPALIFPDRKGQLLWTCKVRTACLLASRLLTVSSTAKSEIVTYLGMDPKRIDVTCEAADPRFQPVTEPATLAALRARLGLPTGGPIVLYVGAIAPHKNLVRLVEGFALAARDPALDRARLVLTGDPKGDGFHSNGAELARRIEAHPRIADRVVFTGFLPDEDLPALYSLATVLALPSLSEGFGLPAVEAMACGTPVLCSDEGAVSEVSGAAGIRFRNDNAEALGHAIHQLVTAPKLRERLAAAARPQAASYTWRRAAQLTLASLDRAVRAN